MKTNPTQKTKAVKELQKQLLAGKKQITKSELIKLGIEIHGNHFTVLNIDIEKYVLTETYGLSIVDNQKDFDGDPISENKKLNNRIQSLWEAGKNKISRKDFLELSILTSATELEIGNARLTNLFGLGKSYEISLINENKSIDGKWLNSSVDRKKINNVLLEFRFSKSHLKMKEVPFNKELEIFLKKYFETVKKSDTSNQGLIDLTIGQGKSKIAIEIKLAHQLCKSNKSSECYGQIQKYQEQFGNNLILLIAGKKSDMDDKNVKWCSDKAKNSKIMVFKMMV